LIQNTLDLRFIKLVTFYAGGFSHSALGTYGVTIICYLDNHLSRRSAEKDTYEINNLAASGRGMFFS
jgi:hypothetical protein